MTPLDVLRGARSLLTEPGSWTQGRYVRRIKGHPQRFCFCLDGALQLAAGRAVVSIDDQPILGPTDPDAAVWAAIERIEEETGPDHIRWQDRPERTHAEVLAALDATIERLEAEA